MVVDRSKRICSVGSCADPVVKTDVLHKLKSIIVIYIFFYISLDIILLYRINYEIKIFL